MHQDDKRDWWNNHNESEIASYQQCNHDIQRRNIWEQRNLSVHKQSNDAAKTKSKEQCQLKVIK